MMTYLEIKNILSALSSPVDKLEMVMDLGAQMESVPMDAVCHEIVGCASRAEICILGNRFYGRADAAIVRGILAIILAMIAGKSASEIRDMDIAGEFSSLNLALGAGRLNGVNSMIRFLKNL